MKPSAASGRPGKGTMMDAFEQLAADIFWAEGYWVRTGVKVELTREDKQRIELPSCPRWEIDLVAYKPTTNELLVLECKSYLDSGGVHAAHFEPRAKLAGRYKLFNKPVLRETVLARLAHQLAELGVCPANAVPKLGLVYGHATSFNEAKLIERFATEGWHRYGPDWLRERLIALAGGGYENSTASVVAKLLLRPTALAVVARPTPTHRRLGTAPATVLLDAR